jgi:hypothetical protein
MTPQVIDTPTPSEGTIERISKSMFHINVEVHDGAASGGCHSGAGAGGLLRRGAALGPVVVLAAWALGGLLLLMVVTGNRRRARPVAVPAEQASVTLGRESFINELGEAPRLATIPAAQERRLGSAASPVRPRCRSGRRSLDTRVKPG